MVRAGRAVRMDVPPTAASLLIVDDHEPLTRGLRHALQAVGYKADFVPDGVEGLVRLRERAYDAVVMDLGMPPTGGLGLLARIREIRPDVPVILTAGELDPDVYAKVRAIGVIRYLLKPVGIAQLGRAIDNAVKLRAVWARMLDRKGSSSRG